jgi:hypothetical protein
MDLLADVVESDLEQLLVSGALVMRTGSHFRIEGAAESWLELEAAARRCEGRCECGAVLSARGDRMICRSCGRETTR